MVLEAQCARNEAAWAGRESPPRAGSSRQAGRESPPRASSSQARRSPAAGLGSSRLLPSFSPGSPWRFDHHVTGSLGNRKVPSRQRRYFDELPTASLGGGRSAKT